MKRLIFGLACVVAMAPAVASAALSVGFVGDPITVRQGQIPSTEYFADLVFNESGTPANEGLFAYDLYIGRSKPGISLVRAVKPDNWVFASPGASFQQSDEFSTLPSKIVANAIGDLLGANQDIVGGTKAARVFFTIDPDAGPGTYDLTLDASPGTTLFVSGDTGEAIPVDLTDPGAGLVTVIPAPEPAGVSLLAVAGLFALRRRRAAPASVRPASS